LAPTGCQTTATTTPATRTHLDALTESRHLIARGQFGLARYHLSEARRLAARHGESPVETELLEAEIKLREQNTTDAFLIVRDVLSRDPQSHE
jgi:hypothetical protein